MALVTGAGSGIGRATALAFARDEARVAVADPAEEANAATARLIEQEGGKALALARDVARSDDVAAAVATVRPPD